MREDTALELLESMSMSTLYNIREAAPAMAALGWISTEIYVTQTYRNFTDGRWNIHRAALPSIDGKHQFWDYPEIQQTLDFVVEVGRLAGFETAASLYGKGVRLAEVRVLLGNGVDIQLIEALLGRM